MDRRSILCWPMLSLGPGCMFFPMPQASFWCKYRVGHLSTCHREVPSGLCSDAVAFRGFNFWGLGFLATVIGVFCYSGLVRGFFATVLPGEGFLQQSHGGFLRRCRLAGVYCNSPTGFFATVPACRGFFASVPRRFFAPVFTSRQGNFKTTKITAGKLRFFGISSYS